MTDESTHEDERRAYWTQQMEAAYAFMQTMRDYPVVECGEPLVSLAEAASVNRVTVQFSQSRIAGRFDRLFYLRGGLIDRFVGVAREMNERGWILVVEDGYRSRDMQTHLSRQKSVFDVILRKVIWELGGETPSPDLVLRRISALTATCAKVGTHMSGSAIDMSVLQGDDGSPLDRGGPYLEMSERTPMASPFVSDAARRNRREIDALMRRHGFRAYPYEFWHYSAGDAYAEYYDNTLQPGRYGPIDFDPATGAVTPVEDPLANLQPKAEIKTLIERALES